MNPDFAKSTEDRRIAIGDWGASLVEYVLLVGLIALVCIASVTVFGEGVSTNIEGSTSSVVAATGG
ncbi:MAG: hypothetical protein P8L46_00840 [Acidimicrobiales bacterium]|nr:hypothetical protein [Acidimicrobiales bacterium]MDG2216571.1 hypothetical protein [Acidimicrobiales bacterium]